MLDAVLCALVIQLGDAKFARREAAHRALAAMGPVATAQLLAGAGQGDLESRRRCQRLLDLLAEQRRAGLRLRAEALCVACKFGRPPWITSGLSGGPHFISAAQQDGLPWGPPFWFCYRRATVDWFVCQLEQGRSECELAREVQRLVEGEVYWWHNFGSPWPDVLATLRPRILP